jgi:hypothetical protein
VHSDHASRQVGGASGKLPNFCHVAMWVMLPMRVLRQSGVHPSGGLVNLQEHPFRHSGEALSTAFGYALASGPFERNFERIAPVLGVLAAAFGVWYAAGAMGVVAYPF